MASSAALASAFRDEILDQPRAARALLEGGRAHAAAIGAAVRARAPSFVVIAARGSSDNAARYAQYLLGAHNGLAVALATPSLFTIYQRPPKLAGAVVFGLSQSGRSPDVVAVLAEARAQGALTIAVTNAQPERSSPLDAAAELHMPLLCGPERAVAATKSYVNELIAMAMISRELSSGAPDDEGALDLVEGALSSTIASADDAAAALALRWQGAQRLAVLGRGFHYATAFEIALKLKETCAVAAEGASTADFLHGPIAMLLSSDDHARFPVLVLAKAGRDADVGQALLADLHARGADIAAIGDDDDVLARARASSGIAFALPGALPEHLHPIVAVAPGQLLALHLALRKGLDPDAPAGLRKVTETR